MGTRFLGSSWRQRLHKTVDVLHATNLYTSVFSIHFMVLLSFISVFFKKISISVEKKDT